MAAIELNNLSIGYTHNRLQQPVMGVIDATLECGELVALIGANGAGKSTLLRTLSAFQQPLSGSITYPDGKSNSHTASELSTQLAVVLTGNGNIQNLTVREVVAMGRSPYTNFLGHLRKHDEEIIAEVTNIYDVMGVCGIGTDREKGTYAARWRETKGYDSKSPCTADTGDNAR